MRGLNIRDLIYQTTEWAISQASVPPVGLNVLTAPQAEALREVFRPRSLTGLRNRAILETLLDTGLRVSELVALRGRDVDLLQGRIRVREGAGKRRRVISVPLGALSWLRWWGEKRAALGLTGREPFFCHVRRRTRLSGEGVGTPLTPRYVQILVQRAGRRAGIPLPVTPRMLRATFAYHRLRSGKSVQEVQALLGHSWPQTTRRYKGKPRREKKTAG